MEPMILSGLIGFASSLVPNVIDLFKGRSKRKHLEALAANSNSAELINAAYSHAKSDAREGMFPRLRASIRPVVTYTFFALFVISKLIMLYALVRGNGLLLDSVNYVWDQNTNMMFMAIISFYFGDRASAKAMGR